MRRAALAVAVLACATAGCVSYDRGHLAAAAAQLPLPPLRADVVAEGVEGRSCGEWLEHRYEAAVEDALGHAPGANALGNAVYRFERFCIVVRGTALRLY